jgi:hypothetical protein
MVNLWTELYLLLISVAKKLSAYSNRDGTVQLVKNLLSIALFAINIPQWSVFMILHGRRY